MFNISISTISWKPHEEEKVFSIIRDAGIKFLEITPNHISEEMPDNNKIIQYLNYLKKYDLTPIAMQSLLYKKSELLIFEDEEKRKKTLQYLKKIIELAKNLEIGILVFGSPLNRHTGTTNRDEVVEISKIFFRDLGEKAKECGVVFCIEPLPTVYGANYICNTEEAIKFVKEINSPGLKINIDLGSILINDENIEDTIKKAGPFAGHFHISLPYLKRISINEVLHKRVADAIKKSDYQGNISLEMVGNDKDNTKGLKELLINISDIYGNFA